MKISRISSIGGGLKPKILIIVVPRDYYCYENTQKLMLFLVLV